MPVPTVLGIDHVAFCVPRLAEAIDFFSDVLGAQLVMELELDPDPGTWMREQLDVHERASASAAQLRLGPVTNIELWEYHAPDRATTVPRVSERGGHHLAFYVDDVDAAADYLAGNNGVRVLGEPVDVLDGPNRGERWMYFHTPWGLPMELVNAPSGMPYEDVTGARRYGPAPQWGPAGRIPTARNVDHVGITVPDLTQAVAMFTTHFGAELLYELPPVVLDDRLRLQLGVKDEGRVARALLRLGPTMNLELSQFEVADHGARHPRNSDVGGHHLAFAATDVPRASEYLGTVPGVQSLGVPQLVPDGELAGDHWQYFRLPWGLYFEVLRMPAGVPLGRPHTADRFEFDFV